jgi:hypothetical protein
MIGQTISLYAPKAHPSPTDGWRAPLADKIIEKLGVGGMGVVHVGRFAESTRSGQRPDLQCLAMKKNKDQ